MPRCPDSTLVHLFSLLPTLCTDLRISSRFPCACRALRACPHLHFSGRKLSNSSRAVLCSERLEFLSPGSLWAGPVCMALCCLSEGQAGVTQSTFGVQELFSEDLMADELTFESASKRPREMPRSVEPPVPDRDNARRQRGPWVPAEQPCVRRTPNSEQRASVLRSSWSAASPRSKLLV